MKFEYPNVFYALILLAIPIIIHLFNFRKYKTLHFSSLFFLKQINEQTKSTQKLKHILVLISRLLAFVCLIFTFAQPYLPIEGSKNGGSPFVAIYVDNSFSMSLKGTDGELLSMAKDKARKIIKEASDDAKIVIVTNNFEGVEQRILTKTNALERIDKIDYSPLQKDLLQVVKWIQEGKEDAKKSTLNFNSSQVVLLSDFQSINFFKKTNIKESESFFYAMQLSPQIASNIAIDSIWFEDPNYKIGINNELNVRIKNYSTNDFTNLELLLAINDTKRTVFVDLKKESEEVVKINYADQTVGQKNGHLQINDKQMLFDDDYYFTYEVKKNANVLIVNGEDAVSNVATVYGLDKYYVSTNVAQNSFTKDYLDEKDVLILNGWNQFSTASAEMIINFLKNGGSIGLFPGKNIDFKGYNYFLNQLNLPSFTSAQSSTSKIKEIQYDDVFFAGMFDEKPKKLNMPSQTKMYGMQNKFSSFLNLLTLENGNPLFYKSLKPYSLFVFASSLHEEFGNFKSNALFSSILLRIAETSQRRLPICLIVGKELKFPIQEKENSEKPILLKSDDLEFFPQMQKENNSTNISMQNGLLQANFKAGLFDIYRENKIGSIAINYDRLESNIQMLNSTDLETNLKECGLKNVFVSQFSTNSNASLVKIEKPKEYWRIFLILAFLFLVIEMALLKWLK